MTTQLKWEEAFNTLDKRVFSVDAIGGYDFKIHLEKYAHKESFILDYGCGKGDLVNTFRSEGYVNLYGTDPSAGLLSQSSSENGILRLMESGKIPFSNSYFDFIYCSGVLHHIEWSLLDGVLSEIKRVLKPNGYFLYSEPRNSIWRRLGHLAVMSPAKHLNKNIRALSDCLEAEWPTYMPWLLREDKEFILLGSSSGFRPVLEVRKMFTVVGILQNDKTAD